jgi:MOSC domain-containing protein YiiM
MQILSIHVGKPQTLHIPDPHTKGGGKESGKESDGHDKTWLSAIFKTGVEGPLFLDKINLDGDAQGDLKNHGGVDKAVCVYAYEHYAHWQQQLNVAQLPLGAFGENFTTTGLLESEMCIGDTLRIGAAQPKDNRPEVIVQLSQPRQPCWKVARRWQVADLAVQIENTGYTGWYFRVLQTGMAQAGDELHLLERPYPHLTLAEANRVMHHDKHDWETIAALIACPLLSASWQNNLRRRISLHAPAAIADRLYGRV